MCYTYDKLNSQSRRNLVCTQAQLVALKLFRMHHSSVTTVIIVIIASTISYSEKNNLETLNNYSEFLNFGQKKLLKLKKESLENAIIKSKVDVLGEIFKTNIDSLKNQGKLDLIFIIDASSSVGESNFKSELKFVKKLLSDVTVDYDHTRVAIVTFSTSVVKNIDEISDPKKENNKCSLLNKHLEKIKYAGGETYTLKAFEAAKEIFKQSRNESKKVLFLITDGFSNGGDPVSLADELKKQQITIFTIGIQNGNYKQLYELASSPGEFYSYLLDSFEEFESLARRALHVDLKSGDYIPLGFNSPCNVLCDDGDCCDKNALCTCGTSTGHYSCVCQPGYYGSGLNNTCLPCPSGSYSDGPNLCLPCPDIHHITKTPAHSIESCQCKPGYQANKENQCEILKCPKIVTPDHAYFVKKRECPNVLNSACGVRCEVGYTLAGSSIRLCQADASWSGDEPSCQVRTCSKLNPPAFGSMTCSHDDLGITYNATEENLPVDTVCSFKCEDGKTLIGSSQRTCLPLAQWDGLKTSCKQIKCPKLSQIKHGKIDPKSCSIGKQGYGKKCTIICDEGYEIEGPAEKTCTGNHGLWDSKFESTSCVDSTAPNITCPENITTSTLLGKKFGTVSWTPPTVMDNSDLEVSVWMKPSIKNITGFKFHIGKTQITYFAQDAYQNRAKCVFFVMVTDDERPVVEDCVDPPTYLTRDKGANITWDEPNIFDNSHHVQINKSRDFGFFPIGTTNVTYTAVDRSGNINVCVLNITVEDAQCEAFPDPVYGHSDCKNHADGVQCVITCQDGYAVPLSQPQDSLDNSSVSFICNNSETSWFNKEGLMFPECSVTELPKEVEQNGTISITSDLDNCSVESINEFENDIKLTLLATSCGESCIVKTNTTCEDDEQNEEQTNIIKRDLSFEEVPHRNKKKRINVKFQVRGKYINHTEEVNNLNVGPYFSIQYQNPKFICPLGFVPRKSRCVQCPKGTFHNSTRNRCQSCGFGFYNENLGQIECKPCPIHYSTRKLHSKKAEDCKEQCLPGTHARRKVMKQSKRHHHIVIDRPTLRPYCRSCPIAQYQAEYGQLKCLECPNGYTTLSVRSTTIFQCIPTAEKICETHLNICNGGTCIATNEYIYSCNCPDNLIGSHCEKPLTKCDSNPCLNGGSCKASGTSDFTCACPKGYSGKLCQDVEEKCLLICLNNGTCYQNDVNDYICLCPDGFAGDTCEIKLSYCVPDVCENNSTCTDDSRGFKCECSDGIIGRRCNILPCDYKPCKGNNTICVNTMEKRATKNSYVCRCPEGYAGTLCDEKINYCADSPCKNGGVCFSNFTEYFCECPKSYKGRDCGFKKTTDYILNFKKFTTTDYIKLDGFKANLTAISACLWMKTRDNFNYGTLISYATRNFDNAFTLTDYTGLVLYINNHYVVTDILLNDGFWHHVCVAWENSKGSYALYLDGKVVKTGSNLATNTMIEGFGNMVIGQEQDILGGKFSQSETFIGQIAYIDVWSRQLNLEDINLHMNDCQDSSKGDVYEWIEIQDNVQGNIEIENSTFCGKCEVPRPVYNGVINLVDNIAYYDCYSGFYLSTNVYGKGRKCTKAAKWEGLLEPYCRRVYCGYPGYVRNGYNVGNKFYFTNQIVYRCYDGYNLVGNTTITCTENGTWYPEKPRCIGLQCTAFRRPDNSNLTVIAEQSYEDFIENESTFDIGTQIEVTCDDKLNLTGENVITCQENGTWDFEPPTCVSEQQEEVTTPKVEMNCAIDKVPAPPNNGYIVLESLYAAGNGTGALVEYKCRNGYKLHGDNATTCIIDGYWTGPNISCDPILCSTPEFKNMVIQKDVENNNNNYSFGNMVKFDCIEGYRLFGDNSVRCLANGKWSRMRAKCSKKSCRKPVVNDETIIEGNSYLFEDQVTIICPSSGTQYILTCNEYGMWVGKRDDTC